jgi:hypothetical protein
MLRNFIYKHDIDILFMQEATHPFLDNLNGSSSSLWGRIQGSAALLHCGLQAYCATLDLFSPVISRGAPRPTT